MKKYHIIIPDRTTNPDIEKEVLGDNVRIIAPNAKSVYDIQDEIWNKADAVLVWHLRITDEIISKMKNCKVIVRYGVGYDNVDISSATKHNIKVCNVPDYGVEEVADYTIGLMLMICRGIYIHSKRGKDGDWSYHRSDDLHRMSSLTLGIIGLGRIGTAVALRTKVFGMNIIFYDPYVADGKDKSIGIKRMNHLNDLLEKSDVITIHTPLTEETKGMISDKQFRLMKSGAVLINTARGGIIDKENLCRYLKLGKINGAALDVFDPEPPDGDWYRDDRIIATPHMAFFSKESYKELRIKASEEVKRVLDGYVPKNYIKVGV